MKACSAVWQDTLAKCSVNVAIVLQRRLGLLQYGCDRDMPSSLGIDNVHLDKVSKYVAKVEVCVEFCA